MQSTTATAVTQEAALLQRKIALATEGFTTKFCELVLKDRNRMSQENALVLAEYIVALKREVNPRLSYIRYTIQFLSEMSKAIGKDKPFKDMTDIDIFHYLDSARKPEGQDPLHKWIGTYNTKRMTLMRFFKWLYYPGVANSEERNKLSSSEKKPQCIMDIPKLKRKEVSCYKPSDLWSQEDDLLFLKWVTSKRDRCYHTMSRDLSARPHEILGLKIKDVVFKTTGKVQYAASRLESKLLINH
jgi:integrase